MLFHFVISSGIADFWADRNFKLTIEAFSFHFKCLRGSIIHSATIQRSARYGGAVPDDLVQYRAGSDSPSRSRLLRQQSNVPLSPR
jgi:hypothetical protein